jgi:hypothetical protein
MNRPSYKELWLYEHKDRDEQLQWIRDAVDGNAKFCNSEPPYSEEEELARQVMTMHTRIAELESAQRWAPLEDPPKFDGRYLLRNIYGDVYSSKYVVKTETWVVHDFAMFTHWMPLPSAPENEDE